MKPKSRKIQQSKKASASVGALSRGAKLERARHRKGPKPSRGMSVIGGLSQSEKVCGVGRGFIPLFRSSVNGLETDQLLQQQEGTWEPSKGKSKEPKGPMSVRAFQVKFVRTQAVRAPKSGRRHLVAVHFRGGRRGSTWGQRPGRLISTDGQKLRSVVKTKWVRAGGHQDHLSKLINYLQNRERGLIEKERTFFTKDRSNLGRDEVEEGMKTKIGRHIGFHKMIISPGDNSINLQGYVRDIIAEWEKVLGKSIDYYGVVHQNTDHYHAHLVIGGKVGDSKADLKLTPEQLAGLRFISDEWLARDRELDTELDRKLDIQLELMNSRFDNMEKLIELGQSWYGEWRDQVDLGLRTDQDYRNEWKDLGLGKVYDLGRPFDGVKVMTEAEILEARAAKDSTDGSDGSSDRSDDRSNDRSDATTSGVTDRQDAPERGDAGDTDRQIGPDSSKADAGAGVGSDAAGQKGRSLESADEMQALFDKHQGGVEEALKDTERVDPDRDLEAGRVGETEAEREERDDSEDPFKWRR